MIRARTSDFKPTAKIAAIQPHAKLGWYRNENGNFQGNGAKRLVGRRLRLRETEDPSPRIGPPAGSEDDARSQAHAWLPRHGRGDWI